MNSVNLKFICNDELIDTNINPSVTVLDFLRLEKHLTGTKEGCREGDCGACTILVGEPEGNFINYKTVNSCLLPVSEVNGKHVVSVEGLNTKGLSPFQAALVEESGTQCGFCTPGFVVAFTGFLLFTDSFDLESAKIALTGNLCRCTGHFRIIKSIEKILKLFSGNTAISFTERINLLTQFQFLPEYFKNIPDRLQNIQRRLSSSEISAYPVFVSGGTDLFVQQGHKLKEKNTVFMSDILKGQKIRIEDNELSINAFTTVSELENSSIIKRIFPSFSGISKLFGSLQIRNRATLGGNINNASPIGDMSVFLLALNSRIHLTDGKTTRSLYLKDYFKDYKKLDRRDHEYTLKFTVKIPPRNFLLNFEKVCKRTYLDIASVNTAIYLETANDVIRSANISAGGIAPVPLYLKESSAFLKDRKITPETIIELINISKMEISPISDARGSVEYKTLLLGQLISAHFLKLFPDVIRQEEIIC
ncbi:MAG: FAD binding domain-containing protein [Ignavibacteria bacterium]|nr:FAD binding domain-containing protein [Ignavibacteria bacterium]